MKIRNSFVSNSSSSSYIIKFNSSFDNNILFWNNGLKDLYNDYLSEFDNIKNKDLRIEYTQRIGKIEEQLKNNYYMIDVEYGSESSFEDLLKLLKKLGVVERWTNED